MSVTRPLLPQFTSPSLVFHSSNFIKRYRLKAGNFIIQPGIFREGKVEGRRIGEPGILVSLQIVFDNGERARLVRYPHIAGTIKEIVLNHVVMRNRGMGLAG